MRIIHLIPSLGPGGAERQLSLLASAQVENEEAVGVAYHTGGPNLQPLYDASAWLFKLPARDTRDPRLLLDLIPVLDEFRPDIIQTWLPQMDVAGGFLTRLKRVKHVLSERSSASAYAETGWKSRTRVAVGKRAAAIVANSNSGLEYWKLRGATGHVRVIRNALTPISECEPINDFGVSGERLLLAAGRLSYEKNIPVLISAFCDALRELPSHHAIIFGDGPGHAEAERQIADLGISDRLHLGGYTESLYWWLKRAECFVSTSLFEGHPNASIEAAASGCPLVLSDISAHREFYSKDSALFAPCHDPDAFSRVIVETISDSAAASARAFRAKLLTESLTIDQISRQYHELYEAVLNGSPYRREIGRRHYRKD